MKEVGGVVLLFSLAFATLACQRSDTPVEQGQRTGSESPGNPLSPVHPAVPGRTEPCPGGPGGLNAAGHPCEPPTSKGAK